MGGGVARFALRHVRMTVTWLRGDCRETLPTLEPGSVQACITSPPYYGLRDYGLPPLVWGGDAEHGHEWGYAGRSEQRLRNGQGEHSILRPTAMGELLHPSTGRFCPCGAWLGSLGLEPQPELYIEHLVECFREVRRVLRDDGTLWLNLGDSYAGSGRGPSNGKQSAASQVGRHTSQFANGQAPTSWIPVGAGYKPKDLMLMPFRVAMALQADGWWVRSVIPWLKRNSMPESVTDRPATSVEYVFLLSKSARYFWDADAVRTAHVGPPVEHFGKVTGKMGRRGDASGVEQLYGNGKMREYNPLGRNRRNSDWFFESWQGLLLDEQDDPLALVVNPVGFKQAHFATFAPKLVEPMVKASTRPDDTVLDPFGGAGTVGLVADRLGRNAVLCELSDSYGEMGTQRLVNDAPMFVEVSPNVWLPKAEVSA